MGRSGADAAINEDDTKRGSEACAFFMVLYNVLRRGTMCFFFFGGGGGGVWVFSQMNGAKAQTLTNGVWLLERSDINSGLGSSKPFWVIPCH